MVRLDCKYQLDMMWEGAAWALRRFQLRSKKRISMLILSDWPALQRPRKLKTARVRGHWVVFVLVPIMQVFSHVTACVVQQTYVDFTEART